MTSIVEFDNFSFRYPHMDEDLIKKASFTIQQGTLTLLYGLSGSGKSTLCYAMTGLIPWSVRGLFKGSVKLMGKDTQNVKPNQFAGDIGYLMQNPDSQFATLTVQDELVFAAENLQISKPIIEQRLSPIIQLLGLESYLDRNVTQLSSGEKQRVVLGSILMMNPSLLILDEPLSFLDFPNRLKLLDYLKEILETYPELSIIVAEHRIHDIFPIVNNFMYIREGHITHNPSLLEESNKYTPDSLEAFTYHGLIQHHGFHVSSTEEKGKEPSLIRFNNVSFEYLQDQGNLKQSVACVFKNISFSLYNRETIAVVGPNGIGKTTLLYLIAGILQPTNGAILFHDQDISKIKYGKYSRNIGLIFQNPESQLLKNTIKKEIEFGPRNFKIPVLEKEIGEYTKFIFPTSNHDPEHLLTLHPFNLSWGEKRRLNLASLFSYSPSVYLFDEPFTGQDFEVRKKLIENIDVIRKKSGLTVISSHDEEIFTSCDRVFLLDHSGFTIYDRKQEDTF